MIGAIIGDVVGSRYEFCNYKSKDFPLFHPVSTFTDDTVCTIAVARTLINHYPIDYSQENLDIIKNDLIANLVLYGSHYPDRGYGARYFDWLNGKTNFKPYNSYGNGSAMRVSPVGWIARTEEEVKILSKLTAEVTHNHPEGIKGAEAIAMCIFMARNGKSKKEIKEYIYDHYYPELDYFDYDELVETNEFDETCQGSVPQAIYCFLISKSFSDALKTAVSIGGDSDTIADMTGAIAEAYYKDRMDISPIIKKFNKEIEFPKDFVNTVNEFLELVGNNSYRLTYNPVAGKHVTL